MNNVKGSHYHWVITVGKTYNPTDLHAIFENTLLKPVILSIIDFVGRC